MIETTAQKPLTEATSKEEYIGVTVLKIVICQNVKCKGKDAARDIEVYPSMDATLAAAKAVHKKNHPLCPASRLLVIFDSALVDSRALGILDSNIITESDNSIIARG